MEQPQPLDEGRPVPPHRSGGGQRVAVIGAGPSGLAIAAALAMAQTGIPIEFHVTGRAPVEFPVRQQPDNRGRRAEKDAAALAKAEAKRQRKAQKRARAAR